MSENKNKITLLIKDIIFFYIKHFYDKHITELNVKSLSDLQINEFINANYSNKEPEIKKYVRNSLKKNLSEEEYNTTIIENILLELFRDKDLNKERIKQEILDYQNNNLNTE